MFPAGSFAFTRNSWGPLLKFSYVLGDEHDLNRAPSRLHRKLEFA